MSDNLLYIIPHNPTYIPTPSQIDQAELFLQQTFLLCNHMKVRVSDTPTFKSPLELFEGVFCPFCNRDIVEWWGEVLDQKHYEETQRDLNTVLPCCGKTVSLNALTYIPNAGFAQFEIVLWNPETVYIADDSADIAIYEEVPADPRPNMFMWAWLSESGLKKLEVLLGCLLKQFYARL